MNEHHVEKAFREHAEENHCKAFEMRRVDLPKLSPLEKLIKQKSDMEIRGSYVWCERKFEFVATVHDDAFAGQVFVRAFAKRRLMVNDLRGACALSERLSGFGLDIQYLPDVTPPQAECLAVNTRVADLDFNRITVNGITAFLDEALSSVEEDEPECRAGRQARG